MPYIQCNIDDNIYVDNKKIIITSKNITKKFEFDFISRHSIIITDNTQIIYYECYYNSQICFVTKKKINKNKKFYFNSIFSVINPYTYSNKNINQPLYYVTLGCYGSFVIFGFPKIIEVYEQIKTFYDSKCLPNELLLYIIEIYLIKYHKHKLLQKSLQYKDLVNYKSYYDSITNNFISGNNNTVYSLEGLKLLYKLGFLNLGIFSIVDNCYILLTPESYCRNLFTNHFISLNDFMTFRERCARAIFEY